MVHSYYRWLIAIVSIYIGFISGFPLCCIAYYVRHIHWGWIPKQGRDRKPIGYIRCPKCLKEDYAPKRSKKQIDYLGSFSLQKAFMYQKGEVLSGKVKEINNTHGCNGKVLQLKNHYYCLRCDAMLVDI